MMKKKQEIIMFLVFLGVLVVVSVDDYENWNLRFTFIFKTLALVLIAQLLKNIVDNLSQLRLIVSEEEKYSTAVHEAGHTIVAILLGINIKKVTIKRHFFIVERCYWIIIIKYLLQMNFTRK